MKTSFNTINKLALIRNSTTRLKNHQWLTFVKVLVWLYDIPGAHRTHIFELLSRIQSLRRNNKDTWTVGYLKEAHRLCSHWLAGKPDNCSGSIRVAVRGLPLIIPGKLRNCLYTRKDYNVLRVVMTLLSVFRVMSATPKLKLETITDPFNGVSQTLPVVELSKAVRKVLQGSQFRFNMPPKDGDPYWEPRLLDITKAGPNGSVSMDNVIQDAYALFKQPSVYASLLELGSVTAPSLTSLLRKQVTIIRAILDYPHEKWERIKDMISTRYHDIKYYHSVDNPLSIGKLSTKREPAGKVRVFAMVDIWTQSILKPLHEEIFRILKALPTDGTFNQLAPLDRLNSVPHGDRFSFDLSAATDRLPLALQKQILTIAVGYEFAEAWGNVLVGRPYYLNHKKETLCLHYAVGQPMGALSSWGMLAFAHHVIVQIAASRSGRSELFLDYALLGDDICIADKSVADNYLKIMHDLGVEINLSKSLISSSNVLEFAKRWRIGETDVSPTSPALVSRLINNMNYLPVLIQDLINRGVDTIRSPDFLRNHQNPFKAIKESIMFSLIPYFDFDFVKCLLPFRENRSFSPKDIFTLYVHTDRVFNKLALEETSRVKDVDSEASRASQSYLYSLFEESALPVPAIVHQLDNVLIAQIHKRQSAPSRDWLDDRETNQLTIECWHSYLVDSLSALSEIKSTVPDYTIVKDCPQSTRLELRRNLVFMQELIKDLAKWSPGMFEIKPEPILKEGDS